MTKEKILKDIDKLISKGEIATENTRRVGFSSYCEQKFHSGFRSASLSYLKRLLGPSDSFYQEFESTLKSCDLDNVMAGIEILKSLKEAVDEEWLFEMKELIIAEIFSDFLEMAKYLLDEGYKDPAAVMIGSVLEEHLRQIASKNSIDLTFLNGKDEEKPKKADTLNSDITKAGIYSKLDQKQVTAWLDLRNKAAHGLYTEYDKAQVELMYQGVLDFMIRNKI